jgi:DNA-binding XRE family transcriptional regulator
MPKITLKAARVNAGMTQDEAAHALNKTKQTIVNWESGVTEIKYRDLMRLSELYSMPIEFLNIPERRDKTGQASGKS